MSFHPITTKQQPLENSLPSTSFSLQKSSKGTGWLFFARWPLKNKLQLPGSVLGPGPAPLCSIVPPLLSESLRIKQNLSESATATSPLQLQLPKSKETPEREEEERVGVCCHQLAANRLSAHSFSRPCAGMWQTGTQHAGGPACIQNA